MPIPRTYVLKAMASVFLIAGGANATNAIYASIGVGLATSMVVIVVALAVALTVGIVSRRVLDNRAYQVVSVLTLPYPVLIGILYGLSWLSGDPESGVWIPLGILMGIPPLSPLIGATAIAVLLAVPSRYKSW
ncbi:MAG: hypothetical protein AMXMBFR84_44060 [Candidatus Hydrogenedentota bacterium]